MPTFKKKIEIIFLLKRSNAAPDGATSEQFRPDAILFDPLRSERHEQLLDFIVDVYARERVQRIAGLQSALHGDATVRMFAPFRPAQVSRLLQEQGAQNGHGDLRAAREPQTAIQEPRKRQGQQQTKKVQEHQPGSWTAQHGSPGERHCGQCPIHCN